MKCSPSEKKLSSSTYIYKFVLQPNILMFYILFYFFKFLFLIHVQNCELDLTLPGRNMYTYSKEARSVSQIH
jgi:hypothetical protein